MPPKKNSSLLEGMRDDLGLESFGKGHFAGTSHEPIKYTEHHGSETPEDPRNDGQLPPPMPERR